MRWTGAGIAAAVVVLAVALVACTAMPPPSLEGGARTPTPPTASAQPAPADAQDGLPAGGGPCASAVPAYPVDDDSNPEQLGGATLVVPFDRGSRPHAAGRAILNNRGVSVAYEVADDDNAETIATRFCIEERWLHWVNVVRRDGDALYAGDTLNLDAHTILSVGDQNGVVHKNSLPDGFVIPPQKQASS